MADIINLLPDSIANQIAAGEVVQRPASVVKELLENSIDAGSENIQLIVKDAGKTLIQVIDDGKGMSETDARMCFERHATSKIKKSEDLFSIMTYGFRGEAMASIAAVAQVELKSKREEDELGIKICIEGSEVKVQEPVACKTGTSIAVKNLFFNVPARRNFLKSNPVELRHILDEFNRVALAYPHINFTMLQNDLETCQTAGGKLSQRIVGLFGKNYQQQLIACDEELDGVHIRGYVGKPEAAKKTRGDQYFFANNRYIRHPYLHHAVVDAYEGMLPSDTYPFYVLFIDIDPQRIDINVHPTKTEIKFDDERSIYAVMKAAVKKALGVHNVTPSLEFGANINFNYTEESQNQVRRESFQGFEKLERTNTQHNKDNWEKLFDGFENNRESYTSPQEENTMLFESTINKGSSTDEETTAPVNKQPYQLHNKYIISQVKSGMMIVDQQAALERILYEKYQKILENKVGSSQQFLFPQTIELNPSDYALLTEMEEEVRALGFAWNDFGGYTIVVNGIPADIPSGTEKDIFEGLIEQFKINKGELNVNRKENLARSLAKRSANKQSSKLSVEEMQNMIDKLFACEKPNFAPQGSKTFIVLDLETLANYFMH